MGAEFIIDCGSRSIKLHRAERGRARLEASRSWDPLGSGAGASQVGHLLTELATGLPPRARVHVVGTAAARRTPALAARLAAVCRPLGWHYETLTQDAEAQLIREALGDRQADEIVNVGGGSIQIVHPSGALTLLGFGISDLNARFGLERPPGHRRCRAATAFVREQLPSVAGGFLYSGGELSYLRAIGARLGAGGRCSRDEFDRVASRVDGLPLRTLAALSPYDAGWIGGAVASNAIVRALFLVTGADHYHASDLNIADGIVSGLARRAERAADPGL